MSASRTSATRAGFAVIGNAGYYLLLAEGIRTAGAPLTDMVIGAIPVVIAVVGNWLTPAFRWRRLALPLTLVMLGLALVSMLEIAGVHAYQPGPAGEKAAGLILVLAGVTLTLIACRNGRPIPEPYGSAGPFPHEPRRPGPSQLGRPRRLGLVNSR